MSAARSASQGPEEGDTPPAPRGRRRGGTGRSSWCFDYLNQHADCIFAACSCPCHLKESS